MMHAKPGRGLTRRRFIGIAAMAAAGCVMSQARAAALQPVVWQGRAMGADAAIRLSHPDRRFAEALLARCQSLIGSLENQLSLYQPNSDLCRLNSNGVLDAAPDALVDVLRIAADINQSTDGAFDVTVQPLWRLYASHFARANADPDGPSQTDIAAAQSRVDARAINMHGAKISLTKPDMAVTLNGIAQGYITDEVAMLLRREGMEHVLLDLGEYRALGPHPSGRDWQIGIRDPLAPWRIKDRVALKQGAIATSGGYGTPFDASGRFHHLFDPASGRPANHYRSLSIFGPFAARADALSTGLSALPLDRAIAVLKKIGPGWGGLFVTIDGGIHRHQWPG